jgi:hypothetical protein
MLSSPRWTAEITGVPSGYFRCVLQIFKLFFDGADPGLQKILLLLQKHFLRFRGRLIGKTTPSEAAAEPASTRKPKTESQPKAGAIPNGVCARAGPKASPGSHSGAHWAGSISSRHLSSLLSWFMTYVIYKAYYTP